MNRSTRTFDVVSLAALGGVLAYTGAVYDELPARMAVHFDLHGAPNGWMQKAYGTWAIDALALAMWALVRFSGRWLPRSGGWRERAGSSPFAATAMLTMLFLAAVSTFLIANALHPDLPRMTILSVGIGLYALAISFVLPRVRRNPILGIRTAFTLASDENWLRTHRFASYSLAVGGLGCIAGSLAGAPLVGILAFVVATIAPAVYSYRVAA